MAEAEMALESVIKIEEHEISDDSDDNRRILRLSAKVEQKTFQRTIKQDSNDLWQKYIKKENDSETFYCNVCSFETKWKCYLKNHIKKIHSPPDKAKTYYCHNCNFKTKWRLSLSNHMKVHTPPERVEMHKCPKCDYQTKWKYGISHHMKVHLLPKIMKTTIYQCKECDYECKNKIVFKSHINLKHKVEERLYKCPLCEFQTNFRHGVNKHVKVHNTKRLTQ